MEIKTADGTKNVGSQGVAGAGLGLGIAGTVLGLLSGGAGLLNNNQGFGPNGPQPFSREEYNLRADLAREKAERYADTIGYTAYKTAVEKSAETDKNLNEKFNFLLEKVYTIDKQNAVDKQSTIDNFAFLNNRIDNVKQEVLCYVNGTFVPGNLVMPLDSVCPQAMPRYNSYTAPSSTTTTT